MWTQRYKKPMLLLAVLFSCVVISMFLYKKEACVLVGTEERREIIYTTKVRNTLGTIQERQLVDATEERKTVDATEERKAVDETEGRKTVDETEERKAVDETEERKTVDETEVGKALDPTQERKPVETTDKKQEDTKKPKIPSKYDRNNLLIHNCEDKAAVIYSEPKLRPIDSKRQSNATSEKEKEVQCKTVRLPEPFKLEYPLCLYKPSQDSISRLLLKNITFEQENLINMGQKLVGSKDVAFIDIGANMGLYTIMAAKLQIPVLAVEPKAENIMRIRKALSMLDQPHNVSIFQNAVSDTRTSMKLVTHAHEQGRTVVVCDDLCENTPNGDVCTSQSVDTVHMDDLLRVFKFKKAMMKIDIEGHEIHAFAHSEQLFREVDIRAILMEWDWRKRYQSRGEEDRKKVETFIAMLKDRGYSPQNHGGKPLDSANWDKWPMDVFFVK